MTGAACGLEDGAVAALIRASESAEGMPFSEVVRQATGFRVIPIERNRDRAWLDRIARALDRVIEELNDPKHPIHSAGRVNEASRFIEESLVTRLAAEPGWRCRFAPTISGAEQRSGYPDIRLDLEDGSVVFLDPKLHAADSRTSTFRTFYYEPKISTSKITADARHLLVGVAHEEDAEGRMRFVRWELADVAAMPVRLKIEFQSSNRDIYRPEAIAASGPSPP
ncbi:MAG: hypothetical protein N2322_06595 [Terrimicrobiaceae bacterium]|nr:hypothetical protein [Terrimicrobiaceae bacterium]